jgi:hypothetical protein
MPDLEILDGLLLLMRAIAHQRMDPLIANPVIGTSLVLTEVARRRDPLLATIPPFSLTPDYCHFPF